MEAEAFNVLVGLHIVTGTTGAVTFWIPVLGQKGGRRHRLAGRVFVVSMLLTGAFACAMSLLTIIDPLGTHPHLVGQFDAPFIRGVFGWLMLHLGILTINLAWYGWMCARYRTTRDKIRDWRNLLLQPLLFAAAVNCAAHGVLLGEPLLLGLPVIGVATVATNMWFLYKPVAGPMDWLKEHLKALVGAGISVYTAFMAFGSVRILPQLALSPLMWAAPTAMGIAYIVWRWRLIDQQSPHRKASARKA